MSLNKLTLASLCLFFSLNLVAQAAFEERVKNVIDLRSFQLSATVFSDGSLVISENKIIFIDFIDSSSFSIIEVDFDGNIRELHSNIDGFFFGALKANTDGSFSFIRKDINSDSEIIKIHSDGSIDTLVKLPDINDFIELEDKTVISSSSLGSKQVSKLISSNPNKATKRLLRQNKLFPNDEERKLFHRMQNYQEGFIFNEVISQRTKKCKRKRFSCTKSFNDGLILAKPSPRKRRGFKFTKLAQLRDNDEIVAFVADEEKESVFILENLNKPRQDFPSFVKRHNLRTGRSQIIAKNLELPQGFHLSEDNIYIHDGVFRFMKINRKSLKRSLIIDSFDPVPSLLSSQGNTLVLVNFADLGGNTNISFRKDPEIDIVMLLI